MNKKPSIFVSSTCYDLKQIRSDLFDYFESCGYAPTLSEFSSFPVNPDSDTIDSCLDAVKNHSDIFILIIGGRYGYETPRGKSITNLEYLTAKHNSIPIYIFIQNEVFSSYSLWKDNPTMNFRSVVDDSRIFEFINDICDKHNKWIFKFELAQEIISCMRNQLANLFLNCLKIRKKVSANQNNDLLYEISPHAFKIYIERNENWHVFVFLQVLEDYLRSLNELRNDVEYAVSFGKYEVILDPAKIFEWSYNKNFEIIKILNTANNIINESFESVLILKAYDINKAIYFAKKIFQIYKQILLWIISVQEIELLDEFRSYQKLLARSIFPALEEFEKIVDSMRKIVLTSMENETDEVITYTIKFELQSKEEIDFEFDRLTKLFS